MAIDPKAVGFGWRPDLPDIRDHLFALPPGAQRDLPAKATVPKAAEPEIWDQGQLGSCTAFMGTYLVEQLRRQLGLHHMKPSQLYLYWFTRYLEGGDEQVRYDSGATIRDAVRAAAQYGVCDGSTWPYVIARYTKKPSAKAQREGADRQVLSYQRCTTLDDIRASIFDGFPVGFGWVVYDSAFSDDATRTGAIPMPSASEQVLGGHACAFTAYDDTTRRFTFRNSWGPSWGRKGYGTMPYEYVQNRQLASDFWTVRTMELKGVTPLLGP